MTWIVPLVATLIGLGPGYWFTRQGKTWAVAVLAVPLCIAIAWAIREGRAQTEGWDAIGYSILAILMLAPVVAGLALGAALAALARRRAGSRQRG